MNESTAMPIYEDGERRCPICDEPLPVHQVWPGARYRYCMKNTCKQELLAGGQKGWRYIETGERKCDAEGCENFVLEGRYSNRSLKVCSAACYYACANARNPPRFCACGCGQEVRRISWSNSGLIQFVSTTNIGARIRSTNTSRPMPESLGRSSMSTLADSRRRTIEM